MQTKAIVQKDGYFIPCENILETYPINKEVLIEYQILDKEEMHIESMSQEENYQKIKEDAILERYQEKLKNQIQYTTEDRNRIKQKMKQLIIQLKQENG